MNVLKRFDYTLDFAGKRVQVVEETGRRVDWAYDDLYRLKSETVTNDPAGINGTVGYTYDRVGNRLTRTSTLPGVGNQEFVGDYDFNDRLTENRAYDGNGNTITDENGRTYLYDAENRLVRVTGPGLVIEYPYDSDGNRIQKVIDTGSGPVTTRYLVDTNNLTGFAQVVEELDGLNNVRKRYTYGLDLISQTDVGTGQTHYYGYDGTGSTRLLFDESGNITDAYTYDAFGSLLQRTGTTPNVYLFHGEQLDPDSGLYYLRARYMDTSTGRFWTMDTFEGNVEDPASLHKYTFTANDPVNNVDPSGTISISSVLVTSQVIGVLFSSYSATRAFLLGKTSEGFTNLVFLALDFAGVGIIQQAIQRLGFAGSRAMQLSVDAYRSWGRRNQLARQFYRNKLASAKEVVDQMQRSGFSLENIAREAFRLRKSAQEEAKKLMDPSEVALLELENLKRWGNKTGPTFEELLQLTKGDLERIIRSSTKSNPWVDALFLIFY